MREIICYFLRTIVLFIRVLFALYLKLPFVKLWKIWNSLMRTENQIRFVYFSESIVKRASSMKTESQVQTLETKVELTSRAQSG